jgi:hypothetical protein
MPRPRPLVICDTSIPFSFAPVRQGNSGIFPSALAPPAAQRASDSCAGVFSMYLWAVPQQWQPAGRSPIQFGSNCAWEPGNSESAHKLRAQSQGCPQLQTPVTQALGCFYCASYQLGFPQPPPPVQLIISLLWRILQKTHGVRWGREVSCHPGCPLQEPPPIQLYGSSWNPGLWGFYGHSIAQAWLLTDWVGKPSKACLLGFFLVSLCSIPSSRSWGWPPLTYYQTK